MDTGAMKRDRQRALIELVQLSRDMLVAGEADDWHRVERLEARRRQGVERWFAQPVELVERDLAEAAIQEILSLNQQLEGLAHKRRAALGGKIRQSRQGRVATRAYRRCAP
ncbi:MAG TPA: flagellar protein FliT [Gammaproteobacteria bacterium]|nr:flagellar protein FliT [Gammaproteobacteria bacterium]